MTRLYGEMLLDDIESRVKYCEFHMLPRIDIRAIIVADMAVHIRELEAAMDKAVGAMTEAVCSGDLPRHIEDGMSDVISVILHADLLKGDE